jgi:hypothetical protein
MTVGLDLAASISGLLGSVVSTVGLLSGVLSTVLAVANPSGLLGTLLGLIP